MEIIKTNLQFRWERDKRSETNRMILHHTDNVGMSVEDIHTMHITSNGWNGIGYNFYVRRDGKVYEGRGMEYVGAHTGGNNEDSIGIAFEGRYDENDDMPQAQIKAGGELIAYIESIYGDLKIETHRDENATACPGRYFKLDEVLKAAEDAKSGGSSGGSGGGSGSSDELYRIQVGAFKQKDNADKQVARLKADGFDAFYQYSDSDGLYRVQAGAFKEKANADKQLAAITAKGYSAIIK